MMRPLSLCTTLLLCSITCVMSLYFPPKSLFLIFDFKHFVHVLHCFPQPVSHVRHLVCIVETKTTTATCHRDTISYLFQIHDTTKYVHPKMRTATGIDTSCILKTIPEPETYHCPFKYHPRIQRALDVSPSSTTDTPTRTKYIHQMINCMIA